MQQRPPPAQQHADPQQGAAHLNTAQWHCAAGSMGRAAGSPERAPRPLQSDSEDEEDAVPGTPPYAVPAKRPHDGSHFYD